MSASIQPLSVRHAHLQDKGSVDRGVCIREPDAKSHAEGGLSSHRRGAAIHHDRGGQFWSNAGRRPGYLGE